MSNSRLNRCDIVLIGTGVMSASFAALIRSLDPSMKMSVFETLASCAQESTEAWNNAGTGHAAYCELNYTTQRPDGSFDISKALGVNTQFDLSRELWTYLIETGQIKQPRSFIRKCAHMSFVQGERDIAFLKGRYETMVRHHCFDTMSFTDDPDMIAQWAPLIMKGRDRNKKCAATRVEEGTDVNFGALTREIFTSLSAQDGISIFYSRKVMDLCREADGSWRLTIQNTATGDLEEVYTKFVFVGAGGAALDLMKKTDLPEVRGYAGFPVSGLFLQAGRQDLCEHHQAKVYGKASVGAPPMSVPHLDTRMIDGRPYLLFGPYAGFTTKFLKSGRWSDLPRSVSPDNFKVLFDVMVDNRDLVKYLMLQIFQSRSARFEALRHFCPTAVPADWTLRPAGQRVQIIKREQGRGVLKFGTEVLCSNDGSLSAVLGASPGASIAASVALQVVERCFKDRLSQWQERLREIFPSYGINLREDRQAVYNSRARTTKALQL